MLPVLAMLLAQFPQHRLFMQPDLARVRNGYCGDGVVVAPESCDDGNNTDGDGCAYNCQTEFYFRDFRLNANSLSTRTLPTCTAANGCFMQCTALADAGWTCAYPQGGGETVTQGTNPVTYANPTGVYALDMTAAAVRPVISSPSSGLLNLLGAPSTIVWTGSPTNFVEGASGVEPLWRIQPTGGSAYYVRYQNDCLLVNQGPGAVGAAAEADSAQRLPCFGGWGLRSWRWDGANVRVRASGTDSSDLALASTTVGTAQPFRFNADDGTGSPNFTSGELESLTIYDAGLSSAALFNFEPAYAGLGISSTNPINSSRSSRSWLWVGNNVEPYGPNVPAISARGIEVAVGNDTTGGRAMSNGNGWSIDGVDATKWPKIGSPSVASHAASGPFDRYLNQMSTGGAFRVLGDGGEGFSGDAGTTGCTSTPTTAGLNYTVSCIVMRGDAGPVVDKVRLGFDTDWHLRDGGGLPQDVVITLDGGAWQRIKTNFIAGSDGGTYAYGHIKQGAADGPASWGSFFVAECQCDSSAGASPPRADNVNIPGGDYFWVDAGVVQRWPDGQADAGFCVEIIFAQNFSSPAELSGLALYSSHLAATSDDDNYLFVDSTDYSAYAPPTIDFGLRNHDYQGACPNGATFGSLTDTKSSSLTSLTEGIFYAAKGCAVPIGNVNGLFTDGGTGPIPRVDHYLYFNACPNQSDVSACHATTAVGNSVGLNKCAGQSAFVDWAVFGREVNGGALPSDSDTPMNGAFTKFQVRRSVNGQ